MSSCSSHIEDIIDTRTPNIWEANKKHPFVIKINIEQKKGYPEVGSEQPVLDFILKLAIQWSWCYMHNFS